MAGFEVRETLVRLKFPDVPEWVELDVQCAAISIGSLQEAATLASFDHQNPGPEDLAKLDRLVDAFSSSLRSWNLTRAGEPIPADRTGVLSLERYVEPPTGPGALNLILAWMQAMADQATRQLDAEQVARTIAFTPL